MTALSTPLARAGRRRCREVRRSLRTAHGTRCPPTSPRRRRPDSLDAELDVPPPILAAQPGRSPSLAPLPRAGPLAGRPLPGGCHRRGAGRRALGPPPHRQPSPYPRPHPTPATGLATRSDRDGQDALFGGIDGHRGGRPPGHGSQHRPLRPPQRRRSGPFNGRDRASRTPS